MDIYPDGKCARFRFIGLRSDFNRFFMNIYPGEKYARFRDVGLRSHLNERCVAHYYGTDCLLGDGGWLLARKIIMFS